MKVWVVCGDGSRKWRGCGMGKDLGRWVVCGCVWGDGMGGAIQWWRVCSTHEALGSGQSLCPAKPGMNKKIKTQREESD